MVEKVLSKIGSVHIGLGGYQDAMFGVGFDLGCTSDFWGFWATQCRADFEWSEDDRTVKYGETLKRLAALMKDAKASEVRELEGAPIEVEFNDGRCVSWRILTEVL